MANHLSKIGLGSAQWGHFYGISNQSGQTAQVEVRRILDLSKSLGIKVIDTAQAYGQSERVLGNNNLSVFKIITKLPALSSSYTDSQNLDEWLDISFASSLTSLGSDRVQGLLVHNCEDLFTRHGAAIYRFLQKVKSLGQCYQIGVSVYDSLQINKVLDLFTPDIIQIPFSVFDQRLLLDGTLSRLKELGVEIHARSIFLQGLLLMEVDRIPSYFNPWMSKLLAWNQICTDLRVPSHLVALDYAISNMYIDQVIVGVESLSQLLDLSLVEPGVDVSLFDDLSLSDPEILNPSLWSLKS